MNIAQAFYDDFDDVTNLTKENLELVVIESESIWLVHFYTRWGLLACRLKYKILILILLFLTDNHAKHFSKTFKNIAKALKGVVKAGGYDCEMYHGIPEYNVCKGENITVINGDNWSEHNWGVENWDNWKSPEAIVDFTMDLVEKRVLGRLKSNSDVCHDDIVNMIYKIRN